MPIGQAAWDGHRDIVEYLYHIGGADLNETVEVSFHLIQTSLLLLNKLS